MGCGKHCRNPRLNGVSEHSGGEKSTLFKIPTDPCTKSVPIYVSILQSNRSRRPGYRSPETAESKSLERDDKSLDVAGFRRQHIKESIVVADRGFEWSASWAGIGGYTVAIQQPQCSTKSDTVPRNSSTAGIGRVGESPIIRERDPTWRGLLARSHCGDRSQCALVRDVIRGQCPGVRCANECIGNKHLIALAEGKAKGCLPCRGNNRWTNCDTVVVYGEHVDIVCVFLCNQQDVTIGVESNLRWSNRGGAQRQSADNGCEMSVSINGEAGGHIARANRSTIVENVEDVAADREADRLLASGRDNIHEHKTVLLNPEGRDGVTAGVHGKQKAIGCVDSQGSLISETLPGAGAAGRKRSRWGDMAISRAAEYQNRICTA